MILGHERRGVIVMRRRRILPRIAVARAQKCNSAGDDGGEKRQNDDRFVHALNPSSD